jgi:glycerol-3-phosphate dehydrogenase
MKRDPSVLAKKFDLLIVGGGATGLGVAVDAATRGISTLLIDQSDFCKGTSSRSTKLVHGGVRYLAQGDVGLVLEALRERGLLKQNAPHLVKDQAFLIPIYSWWRGPFYALGMKVYDRLAGSLGLAPSQPISKQEAMTAIPNLITKDLKGGVIYHDGQFDDARLGINLAQTAVDHGASLINYVRFETFSKDTDGFINGVTLKDMLDEKVYTLKVRGVVNASGVFADQILQLDDPKRPTSIRPSQGIHIVLNREFLDSEYAIMIPKTSDGRVLFAVPWHGHVIVGTTDTPVDEASLEPKALKEEIEFILETASKYLTKVPKRGDILSVFAGLRPLAAPKEEGGSTKEISRGHKVLVSQSGLVSVIGGKWTTYRKIAEDVVDKILPLLGKELVQCQTAMLKIHGYAVDQGIYGSDQEALEKLSGHKIKLHPDLPYTENMVRWAVREEMAVRLEDVLARRLRALFLNVKATIEMAPRVAEIMAEELGKDQHWRNEELKHLSELVKNYSIEALSNT